MYHGKLISVLQGADKLIFLDCVSPKLLLFPKLLLLLTKIFTKPTSINLIPNGDKLKGGAFCQLPDMVFGAKKTLYMELDFGQKNLYSPFSILHSPFP